MTHDQIVTFFIAMTWNVIKVQKARLSTIYHEQARRHFDRYYRIGRHRPAVIGYRNLQWASHLVAQLREDRELIHHQLLTA